VYSRVRHCIDLLVRINRRQDSRRQRLCWINWLHVRSSFVFPGDLALTFRSVTVQNGLLTATIALINRTFDTFLGSLSKFTDVSLIVCLFLILPVSLSFRIQNLSSHHFFHVRIRVYTSASTFQSLSCIRIPCCLFLSLVTLLDIPIFKQTKMWAFYHVKYAALCANLLLVNERICGYRSFRVSRHG